MLGVGSRCTIRTSLPEWVVHDLLTRARSPSRLSAVVVRDLQASKNGVMQLGQLLSVAAFFASHMSTMTLAVSCLTSAPQVPPVPLAFCGNGNPTIDDGLQEESSLTDESSSPTESDTSDTDVQPTDVPAASSNDSKSAKPTAPTKSKIKDPSVAASSAGQCMGAPAASVGNCGDGAGGCESKGDGCAKNVSELIVRRRVARESRQTVTCLPTAAFHLGACYSCEQAVASRRWLWNCPVCHIRSCCEKCAPRVHQKEFCECVREAIRATLPRATFSHS